MTEATTAHEEAFMECFEKLSGAQKELMISVLLLLAAHEEEGMNKDRLKEISICSLNYYKACGYVALVMQIANSFLAMKDDPVGFATYLAQLSNETEKKRQLFSDRMFLFAKSLEGKTNERA